MSLQGVEAVNVLEAVEIYQTRFKVLLAEWLF
jgi:hypothetical protein